MKHIFFTFGILLSLSLSAQNHVYNSADYSVLKQGGKLPAGNVIELTAPLTDSTPDLSAIYNQKSGTACGCYVDPDGTYTLAMAPNDDGSSSLIALPFNFCLYGTNYNSLYINNNGNVSFGTPYGTFSASGFPSTSFVMVAPFWADVDTRPAGGGQVLFKIKPNAIYVNWVAVGYYSMQTDKLNTFQLVLSDGTDSLIGLGNNVGFCYKDMQWTTGSASSGVGGFGGTAANVGANKGDGINYIQFGRFDQPGTAYDGPVGANDGISWLDYQSFDYSTCVTTGNVAPVFIDFSPAMANISFDCGTGDTIKLCATGDTLVMSATVLDPNVTDVVTMGVTASSATGFSVLSSTTGNPGTITWQFIADPANYGMNVFTVTATDNGSPALATTGTVVIFVDTTGTASFNSVISGDTILCAGETTTLSVPAIFDTYDWDDGSAANTSGIVGPGEHYVTLSLNGCYKTISQEVYQYPDPLAPIVGPYSICTGPTTLTTSPGYVSYNWNLNGSNISTNDTVTIATAGTLILTVTDTNGCIGDSTITIVAGPTVDITGTTTGCSGDTLDLLATPNTTGTFVWSNGDTDSLASATTSGMYTVTFTDLSGCIAKDSVLVTINTTPDIYISASANVVCVGDTITLTVTGTLAGGSILWNTGESTTSIIVTSGTNYNVTVNNAGCTDNDAVVVSFEPNPGLVLTGLDTSCTGTNVTLTASATLTGSYSWSTGDTTASITVTTSGTYEVVFSSTAGCSDSTTHTITFFDVPAITITTPDSNVCVGDNITLTVSGNTEGGTIDWSTGATTTSITVTSGTTYSVTVDNNGCTDTDNINVVFNPNPTVNITGPTSSCANVPITLTANGSSSGTYVWNTTATTTSIIPTATGTYSVVFTDANGCTATDNQSVTLYPVPNAAFSFSLTSPYVVPTSLPVACDFINNSTIASPGTIAGYGWYVNDTLVSTSVDVNYLFTHYGVNQVTLVVVSTDGCIDSITQPFEIVPALLIPNIFTPSSTSGANDHFEVENLWYFAPSSLRIFDRWGIEVFTSSDYKNTWDGTKGGNPVSEGVYYYELILNTGKVYTGHVQVARK